MAAGGGALPPDAAAAASSVVADCLDSFLCGASGARFDADSEPLSADAGLRLARSALAAAGRRPCRIALSARPAVDPGRHQL